MNKKEIRSLEKDVLKMFFDSFLISSNLKEEDLKDENKFIDKLRSYFAEFESHEKKGTLFICFERRENILETAKVFENKDRELAYVLYAAFFEHTINYMIIYACEKRDLKDKTIDKILRKFNIREKYTLLAEILNMPIISKQHLDLIVRVSEKRNSYLHYTYPKNPFFGEKAQEEKYKLSDFDSIKKTITYIKKIETGFVFGKKQTQLGRIYNSLKTKKFKSL